ncbi:MAG: DNA alkylation repair protein [Acidobacteriota bacterium]
MTLKQALKKLEALGNERMRAMNVKNGATGEQFGVKMGDIRKLAKEIKSDHALGLQLWETGNLDAQFLAILLMKPKQLSSDELDGLARSTSFVHVANWLDSYVIKKHPNKEALREQWMTSDHPMAARYGWALTAERVVKSPDGLGIPALLKRLESEMGQAPSETQWTMNVCLGEIGIHHSKHRKRALAIGEKLGVYRDYPVSKGCTSPFVPIWVAEMVKRQG